MSRAGKSLPAVRLGKRRRQEVELASGVIVVQEGEQEAPQVRERKQEISKARREKNKARRSVRQRVRGRKKHGRQS